MIKMDVRPLCMLQKGSVGAARLLCDKEARAQSKQGETALMFAAINGYTELVRMLKDREWGCIIFTELLR